MWLLLAFCSAALLGFYDVFKKKSLSNNAVLPVLALNTLFSSIIFIPFILLSHFAPQMLQDSIFYVPDSGGWEVHKFILLKSFIVLSSWAFGYFGMKHLPLTIVGPINATRPVMTLVGAMLIFGERLNLYQWIGVFMAVISFFMLSRSGKKEGIDFKHDRWIWFVVLAAVLGAVSGLYDKYMMRRFDHNAVQVYYTFYQALMMGVVTLIANRKRSLSRSAAQSAISFHWTWAIAGISVFLVLSDYVYMLALSDTHSLISVVSTIRRGGTIIPFLYGILVLKEKDPWKKVLSLIGILIGLIFLAAGSWM